MMITSKLTLSVHWSLSSFDANGKAHSYFIICRLRKTSATEVLATGCYAQSQPFPTFSSLLCIRRRAAKSNTAVAGAVGS